MEMSKTQYEVWENQRNNQIQKIHEKVNNNGGMWVNGLYTGVTSLLTIVCCEGHEWTTKSGNILNNRWCPICAKKYTGELKKRNTHIKRITNQVESFSYDNRIDYLKKIEIKKVIKLIKVERLRKKSRESSKTTINRKRARDKFNHKYNNNIDFKINERIKSQFRKCLIKDRPMGKYYKLLGYSTDDLKNHLESLFVNGMSWDNSSGWHIDHIKPKSWFNLLNDDGTANDKEIKKCWALSNLQPLWAIDNLKKHNRFVG